MSLDMDEVWSLYGEEGGRSLDDVETCVSLLSSAPRDRDAIARLFRALHTYKGNARVLGLTIIETVAHEAETLVGLIRDDGMAIDDTVIAVLFEATDLLRTLLEESVATRGDAAQRPALAALVQRLHAMAEAFHAQSTASSATAVDEPPSIDMVVFDQLPPHEREEDPFLIELFLDLAEEARNELSHALTEPEASVVTARCRDEADRLAHAARQAGMKLWLAPLDAYLALPAPTHADAQHLLAAIDELLPAKSPTLDTADLADDCAADAATAPDTHDNNNNSASTAPAPADIQPVSAPVIAAVPSPQPDAAQPTDLGIDLLESIGSLVTGQAMTQYLLQSLQDDPLPRRVDQLLGHHAGDWAAARTDVMAQFERRDDIVERLVALEASNRALLNQLQEAALAARVRPAAQAIGVAARVAAGLAAAQHKQVRFVSDGEDAGLDLSMLEGLEQVLTLLVSLAVSQSIETVSQRTASAKPAEGVLSLSLLKHSDHVRIVLKDDGNANSLQALQPQLDHVRERVRALGGELQARLRDGGGLHCFCTLPLAMAVIEGLVVRVANVHYVVPIDAVQRIVQQDDAAQVPVSADRTQRHLNLNTDGVVPIGRLPPHGLDITSGGPAAALQLYVIVGKHSNRLALPVDELLGQQQVVIRPLQGFLAGIRGVAGSALLGSGEICMVLDMNYLQTQFQHALAA